MPLSPAEVLIRRGDDRDHLFIPCASLQGGNEERQAIGIGLAMQQRLVETADAIRLKLAATEDDASHLAGRGTHLQGILERRQAIRVRRPPQSVLVEGVQETRSGV